MNFTKKLFWALLSVLLISGGSASAQCTFQVNNTTMCQGSVLNITNTTSGATNTSWVVIPPAPCDTLHSTGTLFSDPMECPGTVQISMTCTVNGAQCTQTGSVTVYPNPIIKGAFSTPFTCLGSCVYWYDSASAGAGCSPYLKYDLYWGDGSVVPFDSIGICHQYTSGGPYFSPEIYIENSCGCVADTTFHNAIQVGSPPTASFTGAPLSSCTSPLVSTMTASPTSVPNPIYTWYVSNNGVFGSTPAQSGSSNTFTYSYPAGTWSIKLVTESGASGCGDSTVQTNYVTPGTNQAACFTESDTSGCTGGYITFCPCTTGPTQYIWSTTPATGVNPASQTNTTNACLQVSFSQPGSFCESLIVTYSTGCRDTLKKCNIILGTQPGPLAFTTPDTVLCTVPATIPVTYTGTPCANCVFSWSPPGAIPANSHTGTTYTMTSFGSLSPELIVTDTPSGCSANLIKTGYVNDEPLQGCNSISYLHGSGCVNDTVKVTNCTAGGNFTSVVWNFPGANVVSTSPTEAEVIYATTGCNDYTMIVQNAAGCVDTLRDSVCISAPPSVTVSLSPHDLCYEAVANIFTITATPPDTPTSVTIWPQGDYPSNGPVIYAPGTSDTVSVSYTYPNYGDFAFCYIAKTNGCNSDTVCLTTAADSVHIHPPSAKFSEIVPCSNTNTVCFVNQSRGADSTEWSFNGTSYANPANDTICFPFPVCGAINSVSLTAFNDTFGCMLTYKDSTASAPCYGADFRFHSTVGCYYAYADSAILFLTAAGNYAPVDASTLWSFQLAPAGPSFGGSIPPGDTVPEVLGYVQGQYNACVKLTYPNGCIDTICKNLYVDISKPTAAITVDDSAGCVPVCVNFTNASTDQFSVLNGYSWDYGDGSPVNTTTPNPSHCYTTVGQFLACLTVTDTNGCSSTNCIQIQSNQIVASFTESDTITCTDSLSGLTNPLNPITFTSTSTGFVYTFDWILPASLAPNPATNTGSSITEQFGNQGYDSVGLIAIDQFGICMDTAWLPIRVANPIANYTLTNLSDTFAICPPVQAVFIDSSLNDISTYYWDFGNGNTSVLADPAQLYTIPGLFPIEEIVTSHHGCADTTTKYDVDIKGPNISLSSTPAGGCPCLPVEFYIKSWDADSLQFTTDGGSPPFVYLHVNRGTFANPAIDTIDVTYCNVGTYRPTIIAFQLAASPCIVDFDSLIVPIAVDTPSTAFSYVVSACGADSVCFTNLTTVAAQYAHDSLNTWSFGDGTTDTVFSPCHIYPAPGYYTVSLAAIDQYGCGDTVTKQIYIPKPPHAAFGINDTIGCVPFLAQFTDSSTVDSSTSIVTGYWNFGDGGFNNIPASTTYNYITGGNYTVWLSVTDGDGCSDSTSMPFHALPPPAVTLGPNQTICLGDSATLSAVSAATVTWITTYNISDTLSQTPQVWPAVDTFYIVQIGTPGLCFIYDTVYVNVSSITLTLDTATGVCSNQQTTFAATATTTHATISTYDWAFGDGTDGTGSTVMHQYAAFGSYTDTLVVINSLGCRDTAISAVSIYDVPHASMTLTPDSVCLGGSFTAVNTSTAGASGALTTSFFTFNPSNGLANGTTSTYTFKPTVAGQDRVYLIQTDVNQCVDTASASFFVHQIPQASFSYDSSCINITNTYTSTTTPGDGPIDAYQWSVNGTALPQDSSSISQDFTTPGTENICLSVTDVYGCRDSICENVVILSQPIFTVTPQDATICAGYSASFNISGTNFSSVQWVPSAWVTEINPDSFVVKPLQTISYQVYAYYLSCTPAIDTVNIWVIDSVPVSAVADPQSVVLGLSSNVTSTVKGTIDSIVWSPDSTLSCHNCMNPVATPSQTTTYTATVYYSHDGVSCFNTTEVTVTVYTSCGGSLIYVPNTFSPNNDGMNDIFRIRGQGIQQVNYFRIYDRWGKLVYEADNVGDTDQAAWNGGLNNNMDKPENSGVFVYSFEIQCITGQTVSGKGNVTLLR